MKIENKKYYACPLCGRPSTDVEKAKACYSSHIPVDESTLIMVYYSQGSEYPRCLKLGFSNGTVAVYDFRKTEENKEV